MCISALQYCDCTSYKGEESVANIRGIVDRETSEPSPGCGQPVNSFRVQRPI